MKKDAMRDMAKAIFIREIRAYGHNDILNTARFGLNIEGHEIANIEYSEASDDLVFHLNKDDDEDFILDSDYSAETLYYAANALRRETNKLLQEKINVVDLNLKIK